MTHEPDQPEVLVVADSDRRFTALVRRLEPLDVRVRRVRWSDDITGACTRSTLCVLIAQAPPSASLWRAISTLRAALPTSVAVAALVRDETGVAEVARLYEAGAAIVFEWPRESPRLADTLAELLGLRLVRGEADERDRALARALEARLKAEHPAFAGLSIWCADAVAHVEGELDALWRQKELEDVVVNAPGVRGLRLDGLRITPDPVSDAVLRERVDALVRAHAEHASTVSTRVAAQRVTLAGSVSSREERERIEDAIAEIPGLRRIDNLLVVDRTERGHDAAVAEQLGERLDAQLPDAGVELDVFGGIAVARGEVADLPTKRRVLQLLRRHHDIERVVDKLRVR